MSESRRQRLNPSKLLVLLLYGTYDYLEVVSVDAESKKLTLHIGKFARLLRVKKAHIGEYLEWLDQMNFLTLVNINTKKATVIIDVPLLFKECV